MLARLNATGKGGSVKLASGGGKSKKVKKARGPARASIGGCEGRKFGYTKSSTVRVVFWLHLRLSYSDKYLCVACFSLQGSPEYRWRCSERPGPGSFLPLHRKTCPGARACALCRAYAEDREAGTSGKIVHSLLPSPGGQIVSIFSSIPMSLGPMQAMGPMGPAVPPAPAAPNITVNIYQHTSGGASGSTGDNVFVLHLQGSKFFSWMPLHMQWLVSCPFPDTGAAAATAAAASAARSATGDIGY